MVHPLTPEISDLKQIADDQWQSLATAARDRHHAWHTPTLANVGEDIAQLRTVVLRSADPVTRILTCHTDSRAPKITQLSQDPRCWSAVAERSGPRGAVCALSEAIHSS